MGAGPGTGGGITCRGGYSIPTNAREVPAGASALSPSVFVFSNGRFLPIRAGVQNALETDGLARWKDQIVRAFTAG